MKKVVKVSIYEGVACGILNGIPYQQKLEPVSYIGRKLTDAGKEKLFKEQTNDKVLITSEKEVLREYEMELDYFLKNAKLVKEELLENN